MLEDRDIDRLFAGRAVDGADALAELLAETRATYVRDLEPELREHLLAAMASQVPVTDPPAPTRRRRSMLPTRIATRLGAATGALLLGTAGLAVAGVNLPDPASDAFDRAGVSLPNQEDGEAADHGRSEEVHSVIEATPTSERGCEFGHRVAEAARGEALPEAAQDACERDDDRTEPGAEGRARGEANRRAAHERRNGDDGGSAGRDFGRETSERAHGQREATVEQRRSFGRDTSERARELGGRPDDAPAAPPEGRPQGPPDSTPGGGKPEGTPGGGKP